MIQKILSRFNKLSRREQIFLGAVGAVLVILFIQRFVVLPVASHLQQKVESIKTGTKLVVSQKRMAALRPKILPVYNKLLPALQAGGTEDEQISKMLRELEKLGTESNLTVSNIKPGPIQQKGSSKILTAEMETEGNMEKCLAFLYKLRQSEKSFRVEEMKLVSQSKEGGSSVRISMTLSQMVWIDIPVPKV